MSTAPEVSEGQVVDVAQDGLPKAPHFEHERAQVHETDITVKRALSTRQRVSTSPTRRNAQSLIVEAIRRGRRGGGPIVEVMSHVDPGRHAETTYHHVVFENGNQGVYPEGSLVPIPEDALADDDDGDEETDDE